MDEILKNLLLQKRWANFNQTWYKVFVGKVIQVCSNEGSCPFSSEDNYKRTKIHYIGVKHFFSETIVPISSKFGKHKAS